METILDHGYVKEIDSMGSDERIVEAARMSTDKGFLGWGTEEEPGDEKLLAFLMNNDHSTPFEMGTIVIEVQAPIFVFREWHRHRTQSYNELSARYTAIPDVNYVPTVDRCFMSSKVNKQAGKATDVELTHDAAIIWFEKLERAYETAQEAYAFGLAAGIPKELARISVPVGRYSRMRASANLRNWLAFITLRSAPNAQYEIRVYSEAVERIIQRRFPRTYALFDSKRTRTKK